MVSSGTEATMSAIRLARAVTDRELLLKFAGAYHGHFDGLLAQAGSGLATPGTSLDSFSDIVGASPDSFAGTHDSAFSASSPFSMTEAAALTMIGGSTITGFNQAMEATDIVPGPIVGAGLPGLIAGCGFLIVLARRRRSKAA